MKVSSFLIATGLGMIPGTIAYVILGNKMLDLDKYFTFTTIIVIFIMIFAISLLFKKARKDNRINKTK